MTEPLYKMNEMMEHGRFMLFLRNQNRGSAQE